MKVRSVYSPLAKVATVEVSYRSGLIEVSHLLNRATEKSEHHNRRTKK